MDTHEIEPSTNGSGPTSTPSPSPEEIRRQRKIIIGVVAAVIVVLAVLTLVIYYLLQPTSPTATIRDIFMIAIALELVTLGVVGVLLVIQVTRFVNLVQNEVQPVLEAANQTMNTLRGTATFLSDNLVEPVVKVNQYIATVRRFLNMIKFN